jgi:hypothetical protein
LIFVVNKFTENELIELVQAGNKKKLSP